MCKVKWRVHTYWNINKLPSAQLVANTGISIQIKLFKFSLFCFNTTVEFMSGFCILINYSYFSAEELISLSKLFISSSLGRQGVLTLLHDTKLRMDRHRTMKNGVF
jgi:hypothetical protein